MILPSKAVLGVSMDTRTLLSDRNSSYTRQQLEFASTMQQLKREHFTGQLSVTRTDGVNWKIFFNFGRILYASGGSHPVRSWYALLQQYTHDNTRKQILKSIKDLTKDALTTCWEFGITYHNLKQATITRKQFASMTQAAIVWVIFDIWQSVSIQTETIPGATDLPNVVLVDPEQALQAANREWSSWKDASILSCQPNKGVAVVLSDELQKQTSPAVYRVMMTMLDGQSSVREIAARTKKDIKAVVRSLMPFVRKGILRWSDIDDLPEPTLLVKERKAAFDGKTPTIACIDDSPIICEQMKVLVEEAGLNYFSVSDPLRAIAVVLTRKPDLIFLDLVMPNTNGYEICTQLRRLANFKDVPIIILTGNDGIIDRVRAKVAGSTDFLSKPLSAPMLKTVIDDHLTEKQDTTESSNAEASPDILFRGRAI